MGLSRAEILTAPYMLKLTIPDQDDFYVDCIRHPKVLRVVALSGGYTREQANDRLRRNHGLIASFSRALVEGLSAQQSDAEFNAMVVMNDLDRFHLVADVVDRLPQLGSRAAYAKQAIQEKLVEHKRYIAKYGEDMPEITDWQWGQGSGKTKRSSSTEGDNV